MTNYISRIPRPFLATATAAVALAIVASVVPTSMANAGEKIVSGSFYGQSDHITTGKITIEKDGDRTIVILHNDFSLDGAPAPTLGFTKDGKFDQKTEFAKLKSLKGEQRYEVPKNVLVRTYDTFTVWCSKFSVPLGSAKLT
jgi:hypothetical protein